MDCGKSKRVPEKIYFCFIAYVKVLDCVDHNNLWKILQEMGIPGHLTCLLRNLYVGQEATELDMKQQTGSKLGKEYVKAVYCHIYSLYIYKRISLICQVHHEKCWTEAGMKHKLESRLPR